MRLLLVFLILMNLLYAAWNYYMPVARTSEMSPLDSSFQKLELIGEDSFVSEDEPEAPSQKVKDEDGQLAQESELETESGESGEFDCYTLGPFRDKEILQQVRDSLEEQVVEISERKRVESQLHRYWVYIPPKGGFAGAQRVARELRQKNVKEFYIVLKGEDRHSVSLGHFREKGLANRRLKQLRAQGFEADISIIYTEYELYWLDYRVKRSADGVPFDVEGYSTEEVSQISRECI